MFALPPKADMVKRGCDVRFVPKADISMPRSTGGNAFIPNNEIWFADGLTNSH